MTCELRIVLSVLHRATWTVRTVNSHDDGGSSREPANSQSQHPMSSETNLTELLDFLAGPRLAKDKDIYLRMRAWWTANDV